MNTSKWIIISGAIACIGCCAIPLYALFVGTFSMGAMVFLLKSISSELLFCLAPLVIAASYFLYRRCQYRKHCCTEPSGHCNRTQCDTTKP